MINPLVLPVMSILGMMTANLNELVRGESAHWHPKLVIGVKTFNAAAAGFAFIWFGLLITAISISDEYSVASGVLVLGLFLAGILAYGLIKGAKFIGSKAQLWLYRLSVPIMAIGCYLVAQLG
ncbi:hypothetical protein [Shewanella kaireitica]|uniref:hypothetical protein n=1 Tax=Shewanella kaireitica TaxID=212021 RepID=UPI00200F9148|nr:hypothetical protein [Shewanella kaireitica]MCL1094750.1 hypothetical protein [Shewanella kaireitica]